MSYRPTEIRLERCLGLWLAHVVEEDHGGGDRPQGFAIEWVAASGLTRRGTERRARRRLRRDMRDRDKATVVAL
jgi:hypothetical protein